MRSRSRGDRVRAVLLSLSAVAVYSAAFPPFDLGPVALVALVPIARLTLDSDRPLRWSDALLAGILFGELTPLAVTGYWLFHAAAGFFGKSAAFSAAFAVLLTVSHGLLFMGTAVVVASRLAPLPPLARILGFASVWVAFELARAGLLHGNPWELLGHAFHASPLLLPVASLGGVSALSFLAAGTSAALAVAWIERARPRTAARALGLAAALPLSFVLYGACATRTQIADPALAPLRVGLVQANVGRHELWRPGLRERHLERLLRLSRDAALASADLIVWSENAVPLFLDANPDAQRKIAALAAETGAAILVGAPRSEETGQGRARFFNSVYLFSPGTPGYAVYDKLKLLPYVESVPAWAARLARGAPGFEYSPGEGPVTFTVRGWRIAPLVCFESIYPRFARAYARREADLLVNVSNDSWFDRGAAAEQHFGMSVFRSPETGLPMVRVANTGITAALDSTGRPTARLEAGTEAVGLVTVQPGPAGSTLYTRVGEAFAWLNVLVAAGALAWASRRARRPATGEAPTSASA